MFFSNVHIEIPMLCCCFCSSWACVKNLPKPGRKKMAPRLAPKLGLSLAGDATSQLFQQQNLQQIHGINDMM